MAHKTGKKERILKAEENDQITWPLVSNFNGINGKAPMQYGVSATPTFYIIDPSGKIMEKIEGYSEDHFNKIKSVIKGKQI
ncbi:MAG: hypothetical protein GVY20_11220 [Bacteroidetes bacterium]|nr:hypothetical protein [Bacteroidota bacterium]